MLELLSAKEILKINVEYLKRVHKYTPNSKEVNNIYQIIQDDREFHLQTIEEWKSEKPFNNIKLDKNGKGYFLLEFGIIFDSVTNLSSLDKNSYYEAIIEDFKEKRNELWKKKEKN